MSKRRELRFNRRKVLASMIEKDVSMEALAKIAGVSKRTLHEKIYHRPETFTYLEMILIVRALDLTLETVFDPEDLVN